MPSTSTFPGYLDALCAALKLRDALITPAVTVHSAPLADDAKLNEVVEFIGADDDIEWVALGARKQDESYVITGHIFVVRAGAGDLVAKDARDRANTVLGEIRATITDNEAGTNFGVAGVLFSRVSQAKWVQYANDDGRVCSIQFTIAVKARNN